MKQLLSVLSVLFLTGCNLASLAVKPVADVNLEGFSYSDENQTIKVVDNRPAEEKSAGYVSEYFYGYRLGDTQLGFDRQIVLQEHLNANLITDQSQVVSLESFTLHHVEPQTAVIEKGPDSTARTAGLQGAFGAAGLALGLFLEEKTTELHSNGDPYFLCTVKIRTQGKKVSIRYYLTQDYVSELNPEQPFESEKYRQGLRATIDECLVRTADKLASSSRFKGFSLADH